jgi:hypothetical protein
MTLAILLALVFFAVGAAAVAKGLLLGTLFSILNFVLMGQALLQHMNKARTKRFMLCLGSIWLRYALLAVPLTIAAKSAMFDFFAAAAGILMVQGVILLHHCGKLIAAYIKNWSIPAPGNPRR